MGRKKLEKENDKIQNSQKRMKQLSQQKASKIERQRCIECTKPFSKEIGLKKIIGKLVKPVNLIHGHVALFLKVNLIKTKLIFVLFVNNNLFF